MILKRSTLIIFFLNLSLVKCMEKITLPTAEDTTIQTKNGLMTLSKSNAGKIPALKNNLLIQAPHTSSISMKSINHLMELHTHITDQKESELYDLAKINDTPLLIKLYRILKDSKKKSLKRTYKASLQGDAHAVTNTAAFCLAELMEKKEFKKNFQEHSEELYQKIYDHHPALRYKAGHIVKQIYFESSKKIITAQFLPNGSVFALTKGNSIYLQQETELQKNLKLKKFVKTIKKELTEKEDIVASAQSPSKNILVLQFKTGQLLTIHWKNLCITTSEQKELKKRTLLAVADSGELLFREINKKGAHFLSLSSAPTANQNLTFTDYGDFLKRAQIKGAEIRSQEKAFYLGYHFIASGKIRIQSLESSTQRIFNTRDALKQCHFNEQCVISVGKYVKLWDLRNYKKNLREAHNYQEPEYAILHANGTIMATADETGIHLSDTRNGKVFKKIETNIPYKQLDFNPDGTLLLGYNHFNTLIYQLENLKEKKVAQQLKNPTELLIFSQNLYHLDQRDQPKKFRLSCEIVKNYMGKESINEGRKRRGSSPRPVKKKQIKKAGGSAMTLL